MPFAQNQQPQTQQTRQITFDQLGELLQEEFIKGNIGSDVHDFIAKTGALPTKYLREQLRWVIERNGEGLMLTTELDGLDLKIDPSHDNASKKIGYRPLDNREEFRRTT